jgi:hypothetical protein
MGRLGAIATGLALCGVLASATSAQTCVGDCSRTGTVTIGDLIVAVNVALGIRPGTSCPAVQNNLGDVDVTQLVQAVDNALNGCPPAAATPTDTPTATSTATDTASPPSTATETATSTDTETPTVATPTGTPTESAVPTSTLTQLPSETPTSAPSSTPTSSRTPSVTRTASETPTVTPTPTPPDGFIHILSASCDNVLGVDPTTGYTVLAPQVVITAAMAGPLDASAYDALGLPVFGCLSSRPPCSFGYPCSQCDAWTGVDPLACPGGAFIRQPGDARESVCTFTDYPAEYLPAGGHRFGVIMTDATGPLTETLGTVVCPQPPAPPELQIRDATCDYVDVLGVRYQRISATVTASGPIGSHPMLDDGLPQLGCLSMAPPCSPPYPCTQCDRWTGVDSFPCPGGSFVRLPSDPGDAVCTVTIYASSNIYRAPGPHTFQAILATGSIESEQQGTYTCPAPPPQ